MNNKVSILAVVGLVVALIVSVPLVGGQASAGGELVVGTCPHGAYPTIQAAVTAAAGIPGKQTIRICPGTYPENVTIGPGSNELDIKGAGVGVTIVTGVAGTAGPIFKVDTAGKVNIEKLTVDGGSAMAGATVQGIRYLATDGKIKEVAVLNIGDAGGTSTGNAIWMEGPAKVTVENSLVQNFTRRGIYANGPGVEADIKKNTVIGPSTPTLTVNGIQVSRGASGDVSQNTVSQAADPSPPGGVAGTGILVFCAESTKVEHNKVLSSEIGISVADNQNATVSDNEIRGSTDAISLEFLGRLTFGFLLGCPADPGPSPTTGNVVRNNKVFDSAANGVVFEQPAPEPGFLAPSEAFVGNQIEDNKIENSGKNGILIPFGHDNVFDRNKISGSGLLDARDDTSGGGTSGTANTWTRNECATSSPAGLCE